MMKKYVLAGAIAAFFATANVAQAPEMRLHYFQPLKGRVIPTESTLEKYAKENDENIRKLIKKMDDLEHYRTNDFSDDTLQLLVARLMMGEAEDYSDTDKIAVVWTAMNRAKKYNSSIKTEILRAYQYSCFNEGTDSSIFLKIPLEHNERDFLKDLQLAKDFLDGKYRDPTRGATYYYNPKKVRKKPSWVNQTVFLKRIGDHLFYKEKSL